jgi:DHA3 family macrolide efflux protein-like MFS transporter
MTELPAPVTFRQVFRNRQFLALWLAYAVSNCGDWLALLSLFSRIAFRGKGSPSEVSGIFIAFIIPVAVLGPVAGVFVDRWSIKRTMIVSDLLRAVIVLLFTVSAALFQFYALLFALSAVSCFFMPAQAVAIPRIVRKEELLLAHAINSQTMNLNKVISPAIAGALVAWAGEKLCFTWTAPVSFSRRPCSRCWCCRTRRRQRVRA